jgi:hypothetical protein
MKKRQIEQLLQEQILFEPITQPTFQLELHPLNQQVPMLPWRRLLSGFIVLVFIALSGLYFHAENTIVYSLSVDFNPSIRLYMNTFGNVVRAESSNPQGDNILDQIDLKKHSMVESISMIYNEALRQELVQTSVPEVFLIGLYAKTQAEETMISSKIQSLSINSNIYFLYVSQHVENSINYRFLPYVSSSSAPKGPTGTFLGPSNSTTESSMDTIESSNPIYQLNPQLDLLTMDELRELAGVVGISDAKLSLIINILKREQKTTDIARLFTLSRMDISSLSQLYIR